MRKLLRSWRTVRRSVLSSEWPRLFHSTEVAAALGRSQVGPVRVSLEAEQRELVSLIALARLGAFGGSLFPIALRMNAEFVP